MGALWARILLLHDGKPLTWHVITNPTVEFDSNGEVARVRSVYTVFQATSKLAFQAIMGGRYHDRLRRTDDGWRFIERDYTLADFVGDVSEHLTPDMAEVARSRP